MKKRTKAVFVRPKRLGESSFSSERRVKMSFTHTHDVMRRKGKETKEEEL